MTALLTTRNQQPVMGFSNSNGRGRRVVEDNNVPESVHSSRGILGPPPVHLLPKVSSQREPNVVSNTEIISVASGSTQSPTCSYFEFVRHATVSNGTTRSVGSSSSSTCTTGEYSSYAYKVKDSLLYLLFTRPEISFTVNRLAQYMHRPTEEHWQAVKRVLRYLQGTAEYGLLLRPSSVYEISAYSDSDWAGSIEDRKSTTGFAIYLGRNLVSWASKKQRSVSRSSTEAEYRAIANTTSEKETFNAPGLCGCIPLFVLDPYRYKVLQLWTIYQSF
ncbi:hypothetical protein GH714_014984 [Hevea brasiliensis]|uniref:Reverse transcriptase Ty1/copia-type domain-containing protein n=1 Tax=Hevea brasiliensis TaxID=3981 RepID=A0A6A6KT48_HEVBR|nr:hypothetical protein GH714_014984 [Hevea brasiliensis]